MAPFGFVATVRSSATPCQLTENSATIVVPSSSSSSISNGRDASRQPSSADGLDTGISEKNDGSFSVSDYHKLCIIIQLTQAVGCPITRTLSEP